MGGLIILFYVGSQIVDFETSSNTFLWLSSKNWFFLAMLTPFIHQFYVWLCWRTELCWKMVSNTIGFKFYTIIFFMLFSIRFLLGIGLAFSDYGTCFSPGWIEWGISLIFFFPFIYTGYSVKKYFGFKRAVGIDHFDINYKEVPFERRGVFKWSSNAMYLFAMPVIFGFAFISGSEATFIFAIYTIISIWLHYFCAEKEDFKIIYNKDT
jgi:hypothetical protein